MDEIKIRIITIMIKVRKTYKIYQVRKLVGCLIRAEGRSGALLGSRDQD
jgi:hypothetical protein